MKLSLECFALTPSSRLEKFLAENQIPSEKQGVRLRFNTEYSTEFIAQLFRLRAGYSELDLELRLQLEEEEKNLVSHYELRPQQALKLTENQRDLASEFYFDHQRNSSEFLPLNLGVLKEQPAKFIKQIIDTSGECICDKETYAEFFLKWSDEKKASVGKRQDGESVYRILPKKTLPKAIEDGAITITAEHNLQMGYLCFKPEQLEGIQVARILDPVPFLSQSSFAIISSEIANLLTSRNYAIKLVPVFTSDSSVYQDYHSVFSRLISEKSSSGKGERIRLLNPE